MHCQEKIRNIVLDVKIQFLRRLGTWVPVSAVITQEELVL